MSTFDDNYQRALGAVEKTKPYEPAVKIAKAYGASGQYQVVLNDKPADPFRTDWMSKNDAKEVLAAFKAWFRRIRKLGDDVEALRTVETISNGLYVEYRPKEESGQSFPEPALIETTDRKRLKTMQRRLEFVALAVRQNVSSPTTGHLPSWWWER